MVWWKFRVSSSEIDSHAFAVAMVVVVALRPDTGVSSTVRTKGTMLMIAAEFDPAVNSSAT